MKCIEYSNKIITLLDSLNPFQINRIKNDIKTIYYISAEILARSVGLHLNRMILQKEKRVYIQVHLRRS
jgi:hypothetical protein